MNSSGRDKSETRKRCRVVYPRAPNGSVKVVVLESSIVTVKTYERDPSQYPFVTTPWNVIETKILPYLDYADCMSLAKTTRQWYRRIAEIACRKCAVAIKNLLAGYLQLRYEKLTATVNRISEYFAGLDKITPMAIRCFQQMQRITWNSRFEINGVVPSYCSDVIAENIRKMLKNIVLHGSLESYKAHSIENTARLDAIYQVRIDNCEEKLQDFKDYMFTKGYWINIRLDINRASRRHPTVLPSFIQRLENKDSPENAKIVAVVKTLQKFDIDALKTDDPNEIGECFVRHRLATRTIASYAIPGQLTAEQLLFGL